jgi:CubicO group peptidase (beta-lactamase class C family)
VSGGRLPTAVARAVAALAAAAACAGAQPTGGAVHDSVRAVLTRALADDAFPGAIAVVGRHDRLLSTVTVGRLERTGGAARPGDTTVWDLASLTKVVGTTSAVLQLVAARQLALDAPVGRYLPAWTAAGDSAVTVRHLLTHTAGLPAWRALYKEATSPADARAIALATRPDTLPGVRTLYSDLDFIFLGLIVERLAGVPLDRYLATHVFGPLGMGDTRFRPPAGWRARIAPTEVDPWRERLLRGEVHDENAFALGGVSGHAGLFSSARDLTRFAQAYLGWGARRRTRVFDSATVALFAMPQAMPAPRRALGWEVPTGGNSAGTRWSAGGGPVIGHTGFTGTSLWMDLGRDLFVLLLTNRVHPTRENRKIGAVRVALADAVLGALAEPPTAAGRGGR